MVGQPVVARFQGARRPTTATSPSVAAGDCIREGSAEGRKESFPAVPCECILSSNLRCVSDLTGLHVLPYGVYCFGSHSFAVWRGEAWRGVACRGKFSGSVLLWQQYRWDKLQL